MRKKQVLEHKIKEHFEQTGHIPHAGELQVEDIYRPLSQPIVPKPGAISDAGAHSQTIRGLLSDFSDLQEAARESMDRINELYQAAETELARIISGISREHRRIRRLGKSQQARDVWIYDIPHPHVSSRNIDYNGQVILTSINSREIEGDVSVTPYVLDGIIKDYTKIDQVEYPLKFSIETSGKASGVDLEFRFEAQTVSRVEITTSPCVVEILRKREDDKLEMLVRKRVDHYANIQLEAVYTDNLIVRFLQNKPSAGITIQRCQLYGEVYVSEGVYISQPIPLQHAGVIRISSESFVPQSCEMELFVGTDMTVSGAFTADPDREIASSFRFDSSASDSTFLSQLYRYPLVTNVPWNIEPQWVSVTDDPIYYNCERKSARSTDFITGNAVGGEKVLFDGGDRLLRDSLRVYAGRNAWMFIRKGALLRVTGKLIQSLGLNPYDQWTTYLILPEDGQVDITNNDGKLRDIIVTPIKVNTYPDTTSMYNITDVVFHGTLPAGIYRIQLFVDSIDSSQYPDNPAVSVSGVQPDTYVSKPGNAYFMLHPWPLSRHTYTDFSNIDPLYRHQFYRLEGSRVIIADMARTNDYDIYHPDFNSIDKLYTDTSLLSQFFDISYIELLPEEQRSKYIFLKAIMGSNDHRQSPVIRSLEIELLADDSS